MEFNEKVLRIDESDENFSDITFADPVSPDPTDTPQRNKLLHELKRNIFGYDLVLCFFIAALRSYRTDRCLRPFPPFYVNNKEKDFNTLRTTCDSIPPLQTLLIEPRKCSDEITQLLTWLFLEKGYPILKRITFNSVSFPCKLSKLFKPQYIFEVCHHDKVEETWQKRRGNQEIILAYHGSAVDNFYSILKVGLQQHFSHEKEVLFGNGIYLSTEVSLSAHYAPFGQTWKHSALGKKHSTIAICEIINNVDKVKCKDAKNKRRSVSEDGLGEIPEKYFVVTDSDMVRVKYLMVYREKTEFSVKSYLADHLFLTLLVLYLFLIILIWAYNNNLYVIRTLRWLSQIISFD